MIFDSEQDLRHKSGRTNASTPTPIRTCVYFGKQPKTNSFKPMQGIITNVTDFANEFDLTTLENARLYLIRNHVPDISFPSRKNRLALK